MDEARRLAPRPIVLPPASTSANACPLQRLVMPPRQHSSTGAQWVPPAGFLRSGVSVFVGNPAQGASGGDLVGGEGAVIGAGADFFVLRFGGGACWRGFLVLPGVARALRLVFVALGLVFCLTRRVFPAPRFVFSALGRIFSASPRVFCALPGVFCASRRVLCTTRIVLCAIGFVFCPTCRVGLASKKWTLIQAALMFSVCCFSNTTGET